jgi:hypothetical protein
MTQTNKKAKIDWVMFWTYCFFIFGVTGLILVAVGESL